MRMTYFTNSYPAVSHTFIKRELLALESLGHDIQRISLRSAPGLVDRQDIDEAARTENLLELPKPKLIGLALRRLLTRPGRSLGTLWFALGLGSSKGIGRLKMLIYYTEALVLAELCKKHNSRLVRVHFGTNGALVARLCKRAGGPDYAVAYHGPDDFDAVVKWDIKGTIAESAFVTAITRYCAAQLWRFSDLEHWHKVHIVRCAVDDRFLEVVPLPAEGRRRLCTVARLAPAKGLPILIESFAAAVEAGADLGLDIVGDGPLRASLEKSVAEHGLTDRVTFHGSLSSADVRHVIEGSCGLVLASFAEGLPVVLMEAMGLGRPGLATQIMGIPELVKPGENGWLVQTGDAGAMTEAMIEFSRASAEDLVRMGQNAHEAVAQSHSIDTEGRVLHEVIESWSGG